MTEPTDAELDELRQANSGRLNFVTLSEFRTIARAVLARWGTPAPVGAEPVARLEIGKTKGGVSLTHIAEPAAFQLPEGMYALYTAPQPSPAAQGDVPESEYRRGYRHGYEQRDAEVRGALV